MDKVISVSFGEVALKGGNRWYFEKKLVNNIKNSIKDIGNLRVYKERSKIYVEVNDENEQSIINRIKKVFGVVQISPCWRIEKSMEEMLEKSVMAIKKELNRKKISTFKIEANRADKKFPIKSPIVAREIGAEVLRKVENIKVDVHNPELTLYVDIRDNVYIYSEKIKTYGGLPIGTNGKGLLLLSGGIDSPVAGFMIAKRGVVIDAVHYHSYPFTSERAEEKVKDIANIMSRYCGSFNMYSVNILNIQKEINERCPEEELTILVRRFMMRIAERIAKDKGIDALITGESLGQVASQTIKGLNATNSSVNIPVFRPLIGMDKTEIIEISKDIETYETSILPFEDCCTVFLPKHPVTRPKLVDIEKSEQVLNIEKLIEEAIQKMKVYTINI